MDFPRDAFLMSHMGEGNWALARDDRPVKLIKRPLGIGGLDDPPTFLFQYRVGPATLATLVALGGERFRLLVVGGRGARHGRAAGARDAVRVLQARHGAAELHRRVAALRAGRTIRCSTSGVARMSGACSGRRRGSRLWSSDVALAETAQVSLKDRVIVGRPGLVARRRKRGPSSSLAPPIDA